MDQVKIGQFIKECRNKNNLTQIQLAEKLGISFSAISMYERGERKPDYEILEAIADYFNVSVDYLLERTKNPKIQK